MTNSPEQDNILEAVRSTRANLIIEACPGSGKTTTLALIARTLPQDGSRHVALAFAKANAEDFKTKLPYWIESSTCHSLCCSAISESWPRRPKVDAQKCKWLLKDEMPEVPWQRHADLLRVLSLMKQQVEDLTSDDVSDLAIRHGVELLSGEPSTLLALLAASDEDVARIDFDDMLRFAARDPRVRFPRFATVMLDEAQDTNGIQRAVLQKLLNYERTSSQNQQNLCQNQLQPNPNEMEDSTLRPLVSSTNVDSCRYPTKGVATRLIAVGDPFQAIYAFRGADAAALAAIREQFDCQTLPLSTSWRCSRAVCDEANRVLENTI